MLRRALNGGPHAVLGAATTTARAEPPPPPVVTTRRVPPPRKTLLAEHVASTAELNDLLDALAADRAFTAAVAHATTGGQTPRRSHSRACARRAPRRPMRLVLLLRLANGAAQHPARSMRAPIATPRGGAPALPSPCWTAPLPGPSRRARTNLCSTVWCGVSLGVSKGGGLSRRSSRSVTNPALGFWEMGRRPIAKSAKNGARTRQLRLRDKPHSFRVLLR